MKLKLGLVFLVLAGLFVYYVFKGNYFSFAPEAPVAPPGSVLTSEEIRRQLYAADLKDYRGQAVRIAPGTLEQAPHVIVHLWASWCGPCVNEVPELIEFSHRHPEVKLVVVSLDEGTAEIAKFLKSFPAFDSEKYIRVWDDGNAIAKLLQADRLPMSAILRHDRPEPQIVRAVVDWKSLQLD